MIYHQASPTAPRTTATAPEMGATAKGVAAPDDWAAEAAAEAALEAALEAPDRAAEAPLAAALVAELTADETAPLREHQYKYNVMRPRGNSPSGRGSRHDGGRGRRGDTGSRGGGGRGGRASGGSSRGGRAASVSEYTRLQVESVAHPETAADPEAPAAPIQEVEVPSSV